ncbi:hypothetical protein NXS19_001117 [Fusarium pseudograminearum]|nr:hypothetical protein NXS19_001117 [Fusarium pseudograminearum]
MAEKTNSVMTLQPTIIGEASSALKWVSKYDKGTIKDFYMANNNAGRGNMMSPISSRSMIDDVSQEQPPQVPVKDVVSPITSPTFSHASSEMVRKPVPQPEQPVEARPEQAVPEPVQAPIPVPAQEPAREHISEPVQESAPEPAQPVSPLSPVPPPKDDEPVQDVSREGMVSPTPSSPENKKKKKLQKADKDNRGFRKLFRKNRSSKVPDDAAANVHAFLRQNQATPEPAQQSPTPADTPEPVAPIQRVPVPQPDEADLPTPTPAAEFVTPMEEPVQRVDTPQKNPEIVEPIMDQSQIPVGAKDSPAHNSVPHFNQGPLQDQPAFAPDSDDENDATPPLFHDHLVTLLRLEVHLRLRRS